MHWVACPCPACVIVSRHIGPGIAQWCNWSHRISQDKFRNGNKEKLSFNFTLTLLFFFQDVITYMLSAGENDDRALTYFFVTPDTGVLHVKADLAKDEDKAAQYRVRARKVRMRREKKLCSKLGNILEAIHVVFLSIMTQTHVLLWLKFTQPGFKPRIMNRTFLSLMP